MIGGLMEDEDGLCFEHLGPEEAEERCASYPAGFFCPSRCFRGLTFRMMPVSVLERHVSAFLRLSLSSLSDCAARLPVSLRGDLRASLIFSEWNLSAEKRDTADRRPRREYRSVFPFLLTTQPSGTCFGG